MNKGQEEGARHLANAFLFGAILIAARSVADSDMRAFAGLFVVPLTAYVVFAVVLFVRGCCTLDQKEEGDGR